MPGRRSTSVVTSYGATTMDPAYAWATATSLARDIQNDGDREARHRGDPQREPASVALSAHRQHDRRGDESDRGKGEGDGQDLQHDGVRRDRARAGSRRA